MTTHPTYHTPVFGQAAVDLLAVQPGGIYVDVTFGGGGHTREILSRLGPGGRVIGFDRDPDALQNVPTDPRFQLIASDFKYIETQLDIKGITEVHGILADLGVSSHQFDTPERGFSFRFDAPLDMRMNPAAGPSAAELLNELEEAELEAMFRTYGETPNSRKLARTIAEGRKRAPVRTTFQFEALIKPCIPPRDQAKYMAQVYQALRIEVNQEMASLEALLTGAERLLAEGGILVVISYHSLEDRMVKRYLRAGNAEGESEKDFYGRSFSPWKLITRKPLQPSAEEIAANPRARSARMRAAARAGADPRSFSTEINP